MTHGSKHSNNNKVLRIDKEIAMVMPKRRRRRRRGIVISHHRLSLLLRLQ
jgi:hypothetical protein